MVSTGILKPEVHVESDSSSRKTQLSFAITGKNKARRLVAANDAMIAKVAKAA